jgi:predicted nucleic acid-binding protein
VIPAFSLAEPYEVLVRRTKQRVDLNRRLAAEIRELSRSRPYTEIAKRSKEITTVLVQSGQMEKRQLDTTLGRVTECAVVIPLEVDTLKAAMQLQEQLDLSPQDSIVYASIVAHLSSTSAGPICFLDKDAKDFVNPDIQEQLGSYECSLITRFSDGLRYLQRPQS